MLHHEFDGLKTRFPRLTGIKPPKDLFGVPSYSTRSALAVGLAELLFFGLFEISLRQESAHIDFTASVDIG
jgi:hypothetical protein